VKPASDLLALEATLIVSMSGDLVKLCQDVLLDTGNSLRDVGTAKADFTLLEVSSRGLISSEVSNDFSELVTSAKIGLMDVLDLVATRV